jgi:hypothetical protein
MIETHEGSGLRWNDDAEMYLRIFLQSIAIAALMGERLKESWICAL